MGRFRGKVTDTHLLVVGLIFAIVFSVIAALLTSRPTGSYTSIRDERAEGAKTLRDWLQDSGYEVKELTETSADVDVLFILSPRYGYLPEEAEQIQNWVEGGKTLVVAGNIYTVNSVLEPYDVNAFWLAAEGGSHSLSSPTLTSPPFENLRVGSVYEISSSREDMVVHVHHNQRAIVVSFPQGNGQVWALGTVRPFTNIGLNDDASANLILNILASVPADAVIGFDEGLHGVGEPPQSLSEWLRTSPAGLSILSSLVLVMIFLGLRGRRFGRAFPIREEQLRREPVEYIRAMANLLRRSGQRGVTLAHYRQMLRRRLAKRYAIDPHLPDAEMVQLITARDGTIDGAALQGLLGQLSQKRVSEHDLVRLAIEVDEWSQRIT